MLNIEMTSEMLDRNISGLETAIAFVEKKKADTHSGIDNFLLDSFIIETQAVIETLKAHKPALTEANVFSHATPPEG